MKYLKNWSKEILLVISSIIIVSIFFGSILYPLPIIVSSTGIEYRSGSTGSDPYYYVFLKNNTEGWITLYLLDQNMRVSLIPLSSILSSTCCINKTIIPFANYIDLVQFDVNLILPNGTRLDDVLVSIADYIGCGQGEPKIVYVSKDWKNGMLTIHVFVPIDNASMYYVPAVFYSTTSLIEYKYLNQTYFETDIVIYNLADQYSYGLESLHVRKYNVTFRFIVDMRTWTAKYWNGREWIPCGSLPIALPFLDARLMLYEFYKSYYDNVHYYLTHPSELKILVEKLRNMLKNGRTDEAIEYIKKSFNNLLPQIWRGNKWIYLGKPIYKGYGGFIVSPQKIHIYIPGFKDLLPEPYDLSGMTPGTAELAKKLKPLIVKAIEKYLKTGDLTDLQKLISKYNGFIYYKVEEVDPSQCDYEWVSLEYIPMISPASIDMPLPPSSIKNIMPEANPGYAYLDLTPPANKSIVMLEISDEPSLGVLKKKSGLESFIGIAIDSRLAKEWFLTTRASVNYDMRFTLLNNLLSVIENSYINMWYSIITASSNPEIALKEFLSELKQAVINTAEALGGREAASLMEYTIRENNPYILPSSSLNSSSPSHTTQTPLSGRNINSTSPTLITNKPNRSMTTIVSTTRSETLTRSSILYIGITVLVVLTTVITYFIARRKK
ncbi:MAG: hypothetical protein GXO43_04005 [Crenarchaeota archaeon]|nr:hypothetical protein [Thermoproteota archaeon]